LGLVWIILLGFDLGTGFVEGIVKGFFSFCRIHPIVLELRVFGTCTKKIPL